MKIKLPTGDYGWAFAIVNGKLAEIHFSIGKGIKGIWGHCYVKRTEFKTKREQKMIDADIQKHHFLWQNKKYKAVKK